MSPSFYPRLINGPFEDPGLYIPFAYERRAIICDIGDISSLSSRDILKISHAFVTHTHMDHFAGFDLLLRLFLGRQKNFYIYGPADFLKNIQGKLSGYTWNLVQNYDTEFTIHATEVHSRCLLTQEYQAKNRFFPTHPPVQHNFNGLLLMEPGFSVFAQVLDHSTPCLGFSLNERFHINIIKEKVYELGLGPGPWIKEFKQAVFDGKNPEFLFEIKYGKAKIINKTFTIHELSNKIARITPGQKITYIADVGDTKNNREKIIELARDTDHLFIEAAFLDQDRETAMKKFHLTAKQAGTIAGMAKAKRFTLFHFSPRYMEQSSVFQNQALTAFSEQGSGDGKTFKL
jgi:ribonuclease Z